MFILKFVCSFRLEPSVGEKIVRLWAIAYIHEFDVNDETENKNRFCAMFQRIQNQEQKISFSDRMCLAPDCDWRNVKNGI